MARSLKELDFAQAFFHSSAVSSGGDLLVDLADYCYRKTVYLNNVSTTDTGLNVGGCFRLPKHSSELLHVHVQVDPSKLDDAPATQEEIMQQTDEKRIDDQATHNPSMLLQRTQAISIPCTETTEGQDRFQLRDQCLDGAQIHFRERQFSSARCY